MNNRYFIVAALTAFSCGSAAFAEVVPLTSLGLYNTGVKADGSALNSAGSVDPHFFLTSVPNGSNVTQVGTPLAGAPSAWVQGANSLWIGPNNTSGNNVPSTDLDGPVGTYKYSTNFNLTGYNPASFSLTGQWSTDNEGLDILLNGVLTGTSIPYGNNSSDYSFVSFHSFTFTDKFVNGNNTLDFIVYNSAIGAGSRNPTGVNVEFTAANGVTMASDTTATPEPGTFALLGGAVLALGIARRRSSAK